MYTYFYSPSSALYKICDPLQVILPSLIVLIWMGLAIFVLLTKFWRTN